MRSNRWISALTQRFTSLFRSGAHDEDLDEELRYHLDLKIEENIAKGMTLGEAHRAARIDLGGAEQVKEKMRSMHAGAWVRVCVEDIRFGLRMLRKNPGFACVAILTLSLGIGATTSVFSVVDRILFRSLPYPDGNRLVTLGFTAPGESLEFLPGGDYAAWRAHGTPFASMTSWTGSQSCNLDQAPPAQLSCVRVESTFLPTFGIVPVLGRNFTLDEDRPSAPKVALLFFNIWRSRFGGDPQIVGKTISLDGQSTTILGVLPREFELPNLTPSDFLVPEALKDAALNRSETIPPTILRVFARLKPGITIAQARASLEPSFQESLEWIPPGFRTQIALSVRSLRDREVGDAQTASWVLLAAVLAVLLIACANIANLLMARATSREREFAIRAALGASRFRLLRQLLTESILLTVAGATVGCALAVAFLRIFLAISPEGILRLRDATLDLRVLIFTLTVSIASGIFFGFAANHQIISSDALHGRISSAKAPRLMRRILIVAQIAVSFILLDVAGLLLRSLSNIEQTPLGMNTSSVLFANISLNPHLYSNPARQLSFFSSLEQELSGLPGVTAFALSDSLPPSGRSEAMAYSSLEVPARPRTSNGIGGMVTWNSVTVGYFSALGIPIHDGRAFREDDSEPDIHNVILSQSLAKRLFPGENSVGKNIRWSDQGPWETVIGVAGDVKYIQDNGFITSADPQYYIARKHTIADSRPSSIVILRTSLNPVAVDGWMRSVIASLDPTVPVSVNTMRQRVSLLEVRPRFNTVLLGIFAAIGILLAAIGTYGVLSFSVVQRTREIGVRTALGAQPRDIRKLILGEGAKLGAVGIVAGSIGAVGVTRLMTGLLYGVSGMDPWMFVATTAILSIVTLAACYIPARRAIRVDPMVTLRDE